jgi:hypothetical protein
MFAALSMALAASASASFAQQTTLTANDEIGHNDLGSAVALSASGKTALVGGPKDNGPKDNGGVGAAWVFVRKGSKWTEQAKLTGSGEIGNGELGRSVALSADGKTALVGAPQDNGFLGAAWVFTRSGSKWRLRALKLTGGGGVAFGRSVALSSDGRTAHLEDTAALRKRATPCSNPTLSSRARRRREVCRHRTVRTNPTCFMLDPSDQRRTP